MRESRKFLFFVEQVITTTLIIHAASCVWYALNKSEVFEKDWYNLGYPPHVNARILDFNWYLY